MRKVSWTNTFHGRRSGRSLVAGWCRRSRSPTFLDRFWKPRPAPKGRPGEARAAQRREAREIRSYEVGYVVALSHLDFRHGSLNTLRFQQAASAP